MSSVMNQYNNRYASAISGYPLYSNDGTLRSDLYIQTFFNKEEELRPRRSPIKALEDEPYICDSPRISLSRSPRVVRKAGLLRQSDSKISLNNSTYS